MNILAYQYDITSFSNTILFLADFCCTAILCAFLLSCQYDGEKVGFVPYPCLLNSTWFRAYNVAGLTDRS